MRRAGLKMDEHPKRTILVVEDVEEISAQMNAMLRAKGHEVLIAADATEAFEIAETNHPTTILTDLDLPTLGLLVRLIREHQDLKEMPIAIIDINEPKVNMDDGLIVLENFDQLDALLKSNP
jgi:CheY-like chemotaxis protein